MYHLIRVREDMGTALTLDSDEEEDLDEFMERYDLNQPYVFRLTSSMPPVVFITL